MFAPLDTGRSAVQVPSGVAVLPVWTYTSIDVAGGVEALHEIAPQSTGAPRSITRDWKVVRVGYGLIWNQSTAIEPLPAFRSLAIGMLVAIAIG